MRDILTAHHVVLIPVVESGSCKDHGVFISPFGGVTPAGSGTIPVVAPCWITYDTLRKTLPYNEGKIHLWEQRKREKKKEEQQSK